MSQESSSPEILSGPFGSLLNDRHGISTEDAFRNEYFALIYRVLKDYHDHGVTQPITPTFGAGPRAKHFGIINERQVRWNADAARLTYSVFPGRKIFGSVAPLLDTAGHDDHAWSTVRDPEERSRISHLPQASALRDTGLVTTLLAEAVHDHPEARGIVLAARNAGFPQVIVSFEPTKAGLPNNAYGLQSYAEVLASLQDYSKGKIDVQIGLNCGCARQIYSLLAENPPETFAAVYPNKSVDKGGRFHELAEKHHNQTLTPQERREFSDLRQMTEISPAERRVLLELCVRQRVKYVGLCCGSSPKDTAAIAKDLAELPCDAEEIVRSKLGCER